MAQSRRWYSLYREIEALRKNMLPSKFNNLGQYSRPAQVQARTRAFLVLSHAELETFFEEWAKEIARKSEEVWKSNRKVTQPLAVLIATSDSHIPVNDKISEAQQEDIGTKVDAFIRKRYEEYYKQIRENKGIKQSNLLTLLSPLGVPGTAYGGTLLPSLDSFGKSRGLHVHNSVRSVQNILDPELEYKRVQDLVVDIKTLDTWLLKCRKQVR